MLDSRYKDMHLIIMSQMEVECILKFYLTIRFFRFSNQNSSIMVVAMK